MDSGFAFALYLIDVSVAVVDVEDASLVRSEERWRDWTADRVAAAVVVDVLGRLAYDIDARE